MSRSHYPPTKSAVEFYSELLLALEALPEPELIAGGLIGETSAGPRYCAIGAMLRNSGVELTTTSRYFPRSIARKLRCSETRVRCTAAVNDNCDVPQTCPSALQRHKRWLAMRTFAQQNLQRYTPEGTIS